MHTQNGKFVSRVGRALARFIRTSLLCVAGVAGVHSTASALTISGVPQTTAAQDVYYIFKATADDPKYRNFTFSIVNKPSFIYFNTQTGRMSGAPRSWSLGVFKDIVVSVSNGVSKVSLPPFTLTVYPAGTTTVTPTNRAPTIAGTPVKQVLAASFYDFKPTASDADGNTLMFTIANKPSWATFSGSTGRLSGTPSISNVGSYANITISVSDGKASASLAAYAMSVVQTSNGKVTVNWTAPTQNVDGTALTNLAGYKLYYGTSAQSLSQSVSIGTGMSTYMVENLSAATWYFAVKAITMNGAESTFSNTVSKQVM